MDFDFVVAPALVLLVGILVAWLSIRRILSLSTKSYPTWRKATERVGLSLVVLLVAAVAAICTFNAIALQIFRATNPPLGTLYTVNGRKMHLRCLGSGSPTIVLEPGLGPSTDVLRWSEVQPKLARTTRVCSYDRAGLGWSELQPGPSDADHIAANLHELLAQAKIDGPIVLMGHSYGGVYIRDYAAHYPADVAGLILVDSSTPLQEQRSAAMRISSTYLALSRAAYILGYPRLIGMCGRPVPGWESQAGTALAEDRCQPHREVAKEIQNMTRSGEETVHTGPFGALPILIISQDPAKALSGPNPPKQLVDLMTLWSEMQEDLKKLSTRSWRIIAKGSGHEVIGDREDLILREVPLFIDQIRGTAPQPTNYGSTITE
jgi:pimeloyl-ACP methyl ester carboxylesterase